jgi:hypothetical protein
LLREVGRQKKPVLLKRGAAATLEELLHAADYILQEGNEDVILCERGVRGFDPATRYVLDLAAVPALRQRTKLPIVVDPSHGTGEASPRSGDGEGCVDGWRRRPADRGPLRPEQALCDGKQALRPADFANLMSELKRLVPLCGRRWARSPPRARWQRRGFCGRGPQRGVPSPGRARCPDDRLARRRGHCPVTHRARKPYIAGNWKMNLDRSRSLDLIKTVKGRIGDGSDREVRAVRALDLPRRRHGRGAGLSSGRGGAEHLVRGQRRVHG